VSRSIHPSPPSPRHPMRLDRKAKLAVFVVLVALGLFAVPITVPLAAQPSGDSPQTDLVHGFTEAFNSGDPATLVAFFRDHATPEWLAERPEADRMDLFGRMMKDLGRVEVEGVDSEGDDRIVVRATAEGVDDPVRFELTLEPDAPYRITGLGVDIAPVPPSDLPPLPPFSGASGDGKLAEPDRAALDHYFRDLAAADRFSGTVLLAIDGTPVFEGAYGLADRDWEVPNRMSTRFDVGSINKELTKVAIGQLLAAGKLSLADTILDLLPDYPNPDAGSRVTLAQLLDHTSGLGDIFGPEFFRMNKAQLRANRDYFPLFADKPLLFEPGTDRRYSNAGYLVLGAIVAQVSGETYADYVTRHVFEPAGMTRAAFAARDAIRHDVAVSYTRQPRGDGTPAAAGPDRSGPGEPSGADEEAPLRPATFMLPVVGMGAGSAVATAADLLAFDRALRTHRLLDPRYTAWFFTGELPVSGDERREASGAPAAFPIGIAGGAPGVNAILEGDGRHTAVLLSNVDPPTAEALGLELARKLEALVPSDRPDAADRSDAADAADGSDPTDGQGEGGPGGARRG